MIEHITDTSPSSGNELILKYKSAGIYGQSRRFVELLQTIDAATHVDTRVLLIGKTGTGKELIARSIHTYSSRSGFPFIAADCGAIPETLIESEFFGHTKGAYTGALSERHGLFIEANGGTLFLDEINNLPIALQAKFLRVIEEQKIRPVGSDHFRDVNVRIIAASSVPLKELVNKNLFREDLFYRLHVYPIHIPSLQERKSDIRVLAVHFLKKFSLEQNKTIAEFEPEVIKFLTFQSWHGNIRQLQNFIEQLVTLTPPGTNKITLSMLPEPPAAPIVSESTQTSELPLRARIDQYEARILREVLKKHDWNQSGAARELKISESNIRYKMQHLNISPDNKNNTSS